MPGMEAKCDGRWNSMNILINFIIIKFIYLYACHLPRESLPARPSNESHILEAKQSLQLIRH
jgi:hypothetical protein